MTLPSDWLSWDAILANSSGWLTLALISTLDSMSTENGTARRDIIIIINVSHSNHSQLHYGQVASRFQVV